MPSPPAAAPAGREARAWATLQDGMRRLIETLEAHPRIGPHLVYRGRAEGRAAAFAEPRTG